MPYSDRYITLVRVGRIVTACAYITLTSNWAQVSNVSVNETIPDVGFQTVRRFPRGHARDNSGATSFYLYGTPEGKMVLNGTGYTSRFVGISGCWITASTDARNFIRKMVLRTAPTGYASRERRIYRPIRRYIRLTA